MKTPLYHSFIAYIREQDEAYINSLRWLTLMGLEPVTGQNVPMPKRPNVKMSHSQNVPSQNVPKS